MPLYNSVFRPLKINNCEVQIQESVYINNHRKEKRDLLCGDKKQLKAKGGVKLCRTAAPYGTCSFDPSGLRIQGSLLFWCLFMGNIDGVTSSVQETAKCMCLGMSIFHR